MPSTIHVRTRVLPGGRIEITSPDLKEGDEVEVVLTPSKAPASARPSMLDFLESLPPHARLFQTPEDIDRYIQEERDLWER